VANYAFLNLWFKDFTVERGLEHLQALLTLFPVASTQPGFWRVLVRAIDPGQAPLVEHAYLPTPEAARQQAAELWQADCACELAAYWNLWQWSLGPGPKLEWADRPSPVEFLLYGEGFDEAYFREAGQVQIHLGFEHLYTGHAQILDGAEIRPQDAESRAEQEFTLALLEEDSLQVYRQHTRENVRRLYAFLHQAEKSLPIENHRLWSEGEADFARHTEEILAPRE
jgi:hypothetical protein